MIDRRAKAKARKERDRKQKAVAARASGFRMAPAAGPEISPHEGISAEKFVRSLSPSAQRILDGIRRAKATGRRPRPSASPKVAGDALLLPHRRGELLDKVAELVDQNVFGRSEMCLQFAALLELALRELGHDARAVEAAGARYRCLDETWMVWPRHAWVEVGDVVIDANVDSLAENPVATGARPIDVAPFWGPRTALPADRQLPAGRPLDRYEAQHGDVLAWWEQLRAWMRSRDWHTKPPMQWVLSDGTVVEGGGRVVGTGETARKLRALLDDPPVYVTVGPMPDGSVPLDPHSDFLLDAFVRDKGAVARTRRRDRLRAETGRRAAGRAGTRARARRRAARSGRDPLSGLRHHTFGTSVSASCGSNHASATPALWDATKFCV